MFFLGWRALVLKDFLEGKKKVSYFFFTLFWAGGRRVWVTNYPHWLAVGIFFGAALADSSRVRAVLFVGRRDRYVDHVDPEFDVFGEVSLGGDVGLDCRAGSFERVKADGLRREG